MKTQRQTIGLFSIRLYPLLFVAINLIWICAASGQNMDAKYCKCTRNSSIISKDSPDTTYMHIDTALQFEFKKNGTFTRTDRKFTEIYTPSTRKVRYMGKKFRVIKGKYKRDGNRIYILRASAEGILNKTYELEEINHWTGTKHVMWDFQNEYRLKYSKIGNFQDCEGLITKKQALMKCYHYTTSTKQTDTFRFWAIKGECRDVAELIQPKFLYPGVHLNLHTYFAYRAEKNYRRYDSAFSFQDKHTYNSRNGQLVRYFYYGSKKDSLKAAYYEFEYYSLSQYSHHLNKIFDSQDNSYFLFRRDSQDCISGIDHFNNRNELMETYRW